MLVVRVGNCAPQRGHDKGDLHHELQIESARREIRIDDRFVLERRLAGRALLALFPGSLAGVLPAEIERIAGGIGPASGRTGGTASTAIGPELVVFLPVFGVAQHLVGFGDAFELLLGFFTALVGVGMVLAGQLAVPFFDIADFGALFDPEDLVIIFFYRNFHDFPMRA